MAGDLLEKGSIMQRDKETYAVTRHIPGGIITDFNLLRRVADVAEKYGVKAIKLTSAQRFSLVGLKLEDLDPVWQDLGLLPGATIGLCVRSIKISPAPPSAASPSRTRWGWGSTSMRSITACPYPSSSRSGSRAALTTFPRRSSRTWAWWARPRAGGCWPGGFASSLKPRLADLIATHPDGCGGHQPARAGAGLAQAS